MLASGRRKQLPKVVLDNCSVPDGSAIRERNAYPSIAVGRSLGKNLCRALNVKRIGQNDLVACRRSFQGKFLYRLLEGPLWDAEKKHWEKVDGKEASRILEFDVAVQNFTGGYWQYVFEQNGNAIGDFNMIDATSGLIIERDNGEGTDDKACPQSQPARTASPISASSSDDNEFMLLEVGKFLKTK